MALLVLIAAVLAVWFFGHGGSSSAPSGTGNTAGTGDPGSQIGSYGLDAIAQAVAMVESGNRQYDANGNVITSPAGALGIMQLKPSTAADVGVNPYDAQQNYAGGKTYLQQLYSKYGNWNDALAAYNWGPGHVDQALASGYGFPQQVQQYISNVESNVG